MEISRGRRRSCRAGKAREGHEFTRAVNSQKKGTRLRPTGRINTGSSTIVGGIANHVHVLLSLPAVLPLSKAMQLIKGASSHWMNENHTRDFAWQEGYGAFTVGISQKDQTISYIRRQPEHHKKRSFEEEFVTFLKKHGVEYDPQHVWG